MRVTFSRNRPRKNSREATNFRECDRTNQEFDTMNDTPEIVFMRRPAAFCVFGGCRERASYHQMPICREHAAQAWLTFDEEEPEQYKRLIRGETAEVAAEIRAAKAKKQEAKRLSAHRAGTIYYLRIADRVKIGFTTDLYQRMGQYPPNSEILATHPGTPTLERETHKRFAMHLADGREWFHPHAALDKHILKVQEQFPDSPTMAELRESMAPIKTEVSSLRPRTSRLARKI